MKTNNNKAIIYDDNCPLCKAYTSAFVKGGFLQKENRIAFSKVNMQQFNIDWYKAKHEIPLVNLQTGEVKYGVDALTDILQQKISIIKPIMKVYIFNWFFRKLYKLISYNRKIIVASEEQHLPSIDCTPDYSFFWRWLLIIICYIISNIFFVTASNRVFSLYEMHLFTWVITCWIIVPVIHSMQCSKKKATDIHAHASVTATITGFLLFISSYFLKYFCQTPLVFYIILSLILWISTKQIIKRHHHIKYLYTR